MKRSTAKAKRAKKQVLKHPTWEHPEGSGIKIAEMPNKTAGKAFGVSYQIRIPAELLGIVGKREMVQRKTKKEAESFAEDRFIALKKHGTEFSKIPPDAQKQGAIAWSILDKHNTKAGTKISLIEAVEAGIKALCPAGGRRTIAQVVEELAKSKEARREAKGLDATTLHDFKIRSSRIVKKFGERYAGDISHIDLLGWLAELAKSGAQFGGGLSPRSVRNYRNTLREVFHFARAKEYCPSDPFDRFTSEDFKSLGGEGNERNLDGITALKVDEVRKLLKAAQESEEEGFLASTVLRLFCGLRTKEVILLDWSEVHWLEDKPYVHVPAGKAKKRRIRHVDIPDNAVAWLKLCNPPKTGRIVPGTDDHRKDVKAYCTRFNRVTAAAGIVVKTKEGEVKSDWEVNDTRHSFGSYHYALHGDALRTAGQMGHKQGDDVLFNHYRQLVTKAHAEEYFNIRPAVEDSKVTAFPNAATA